MLNLKSLRYFCEAVAAGSARAAAETLFVAPTAISMQLAQLEARLGGPLFDRTKRPMALTPLGQFVYPKAKELLAGAQRLEHEAQGIAAGKLGWLGIGFTRSTIFSILPDAVRAMQAAYPQVRVDLLEILTEDQPASLRSGAIHLGVARTLGPFRHEPDLEYIDLFDDPLVAVVPMQHRLAGRASLRAAELDALPCVSYPRMANAHFWREVVALMQGAGARIEVAHEAKEIHTALALVAAGLGITIVGQSVSTNNRTDIRFIPISDLGDRSRVIAIRRAGVENPLADDFLRKLRARVPGAAAAEPSAPRRRAPRRVAERAP